MLQKKSTAANNRAALADARLIAPDKGIAGFGASSSAEVQYDSPFVVGGAAMIIKRLP